MGNAPLWVAGRSKLGWTVALLLASLLAGACGGGASDEGTEAPADDTEAAAGATATDVGEATEPAGEATPTVTGDGGTDDAAATAAATPTEALPLRVAQARSASGLPIWVAQDEGIFAANGLDVEVTEVENITTLPAAIGQQFDIGLTVQPILISAAASGIPLAAVAGCLIDTADNPQILLLAPADSDIQSIEDLVGRRVATVTIAGTNTLSLKNQLAEAGIDPDDVTFVEVPRETMADQLAAGVVDVILPTQPIASQLADEGLTNLGDPFRSIGDTVHGSFFMTSPQWAEENQETVERFRTSLEQAIEFVESDEDRAREILGEHTGLPADVLTDFPMPTFSATITEEDIAPWIDIMREHADFQGDVDVSALVIP